MAKAPKPFIFSEQTDFENGMNEWEFKSWMPDSREATSEVFQYPKSGPGQVLKIFADGRDDDGIIFIEKQFITPELTNHVQISWRFAQYSPKALIGVWPRVIYIGPKKDLAQKETQHEFVWLAGSQNVVYNPGDEEWATSFFSTKLPRKVKNIQISVGWKINWETKRESFIDMIRVEMPRVL